MSGIVIEDFKEVTHEHINVELVAKILRGGIIDGNGAFVLSYGFRYPQLWLHSCGERWYAHYFEAEGSPGSYALGMVVSEVPNMQMIPYGSGDFCPPSDGIIDEEFAFAIAEEFASNPKRPDCADWFDL